MSVLASEYVPHEMKEKDVSIVLYVRQFFKL